MLLGLYYFITVLYCPNPDSGLQYRNKRIVSYVPWRPARYFGVLSTRFY